MEKAREFRKTSTSASLTTLKPDCVDHNKLQTILKEMRIPDHLTCLLRNLHAGQEAKIKTGLNNGLVQNWERNTTRQYSVLVLI